MITVKKICEAGYDAAMLGLSLSRNRPLDDMPEVARKLADKDGGHNKFLESIAVWLDIRAPRYFWQQFDIYRIGVTKQSESTMYGLKHELTQRDFSRTIDPVILTRLNYLIANGDFEQVKTELPEGFMQRRIVATNYKALRGMILQRRNHRLIEWRDFCAAIYDQVDHSELLPAIAHIPVFIECTHCGQMNDVMTKCVCQGG